MNSKKVLIIGSIVFVVIVACIVIYVLVYGVSFDSSSEIGSGSLDFIYKSC